MQRILLAGVADVSLLAPGASSVTSFIARPQ
jgi:hypothetical protein